MQYSKSLLGILFVIGLLALTGCMSSPANSHLDILPPQLDTEGRFWIYGDAIDGLGPFIPYGWMPEHIDRMMTVDVDSSNFPHREDGKLESKATCIEIAIDWKIPYWTGIAFISGPDAPPWWGAENRGWYYDLRQLPKKRLVFFARGESGAERIQVKLGILGEKRYGDSLKFPLETRWLRLTKEWREYSLDLSGSSPAELSRICSGFSFFCSREKQDGKPRHTRFWIDTIYLE